MAQSAVGLFPNGTGSEAFQRGRRLTLEFSGNEIPVLQKIQYRCRRGEDPTFWEQNHPTQSFSWTEVPQALSMLFADYLVWDKTSQGARFNFSGTCFNSHAQSLGDAIYGSGPIQELFSGTESPGQPIKPHTKLIFVNGDNIHGRATIERDRRISVSQNFLPPDCVEIFWPARSQDSLKAQGDLELLAKRLRLSLNLPLSPGMPKEEVSVPPTPPAAPNTSPAKPSRLTPPPLPKPAIKLELEDFPEWDKWRCEIAFRILQGMKVEEIFNDSREMQKESTSIERLTRYYELLLSGAIPPDGTVLPEHFKIVATDYYWPHDMRIWTVGKEEWTLDDVTQGTLIFGATGSGKTTCSGRTIAMAMLAKQFGGLILTTKPGEGREWTVICNAMGRLDHVRWIRLGGPLRLNLLAYESQRPGAGAQITENLVGFFRMLLSAIGQQHGRRTNEGFWRDAGNQLLRNLLEIFLAAKVSLSLDRLADFVTEAPVKLPADKPDAWRDIPLFGEVLTSAEANAITPSDLRMVDKAKKYWLMDYQTLPAETRGCITFAFKAILDVLRSRQIYELLCSETTITPECIFNGHIVILDIPVKEYGDAAILVQCAFKYLFQRAVERRKDLGDQTRPVFMFIDEAQNFFTEYDTTFQQTARSSRVATVMLSQNVNNFYARLGGDNQARYLFDSLAGNLNTKIFHANGDTLTNEWASKMLGTWDRPVSSTSASTNPHQSMNLFDSQQPTIGHGMTTRREPFVFPDEFAKLKSSNSKSEGESEAYVYRIGSLFEQTGLPFIKTSFNKTLVQETPKS